MHRTLRRGGPLALVVLAALAGGCGNDSKPARSSGDVANISGTAASSTSGSNVDAGRPQLRMDTSDEERQALYDRFWQCLKDHGIPMGEKNGHLAPKEGTVDHPDCASKRPLIAPELDEKRNPHYKDQFHAYVKCLRDHGVMVHEVPDGWTYDQDYNSRPDESKIDKTCERDSFKV